MNIIIYSFNSSLVQTKNVACLIVNQNVVTLLWRIYDSKFILPAYLCLCIRLCTKDLLCVPKMAPLFQCRHVQSA